MGWSDTAADRTRLLSVLETLLSVAHSHGATEPRDFIFGLYALFLRAGLSLPTPDYSKSVSAIYSKATKALIQQSESLRVLDHIDCDRRSLELPSWAHDFRSNSGVLLGGCWSASRDSKVKTSLSIVSAPQSFGLKVCM
jgi:hypothetical protein